ncbi:hypothetical protein PPUJ20066_42660 [Pseudomonas putida]|nr:hypothetical protein PPUJ20066_42660 [Pseudomonas putida]
MPSTGPAGIGRAAGPLTIDGPTTVSLECRLFSPTCVVKAMRRNPSLPPARQPALQALRRAWPSDTVLKRRRSVLFAFTFSPHLALN